MMSAMYTWILIPLGSLFAPLGRLVQILIAAGLLRIRDVPVSRDCVMTRALD